MEKLLLQKRELTGKKVKQLLRKKILPGVIYNSKGDSDNIQLSMSDAIKLVNKATLSTIVDLEIDGKRICKLFRTFEDAVDFRKELEQKEPTFYNHLT